MLLLLHFNTIYMKKTTVPSPNHEGLGGSLREIRSYYIILYKRNYHNSLRKCEATIQIKIFPPPHKTWRIIVVVPATSVISGLQVVAPYFLPAT